MICSFLKCFVFLFIWKERALFLSLLSLQYHKHKWYSRGRTEDIRLKFTWNLLSTYFMLETCMHDLIFIFIKYVELGGCCYLSLDSLETEFRELTCWGHVGKKWKRQDWKAEFLILQILLCSLHHRGALSMNIYLIEARVYMELVLFLYFGLRFKVERFVR